MYELILQSKKPNAEKFKKWTFKVISQIRKGEIKVKDSDYKTPLSFDDKGQIIHYDNTSCDDKENIFYNDGDDDMQILNMLSRTINYKHYFNKNVLYCYASSMVHYDKETQQHKKELLIKMGYSKHFDKRTSEHIHYYGCQFKLIAIKEVNDEDDEKKFHKHIQFKYPNLYHRFGIRDNKGVIKYATEFYIFDFNLIEEFYDYNIDLKTYQKPITNDDIENNKILLELQKEKNREIELRIELYKLKNNIE